MTSMLAICQPRPVDLLPPTLQTIPEAIDMNVAIAGARTRSPIMAVVKADGYGHGAITARRPRSPPEQNGYESTCTWTPAWPERAARSMRGTR